LKENIDLPINFLIIISRKHAELARGAIGCRVISVGTKYLRVGGVAQLHNSTQGKAGEYRV
jgi:hypothetical protein